MLILMGFMVAVGLTVGNYLYQLRPGTYLDLDAALERSIFQFFAIATFVGFLYLMQWMGVLAITPNTGPS